MGWFYRFAKGLASTVFTVWGWQIEGREHIPAEGGFILAPNHISNLDPPVVGCACPRVIHTMGKQELFRHQPLKWILEHLNGFPVNRGEMDMKAMKTALKVLKSGECLLLFPEGTRRKTGDPMRFKARAGVGMLAMKTKVPIVPAGIYGTEQRQKFIIRFGEPITPEMYAQYPQTAEGYQQLSDELMRRIAELAQPPTPKQLK